MPENWNQEYIVILTLILHNAWNWKAKEAVYDSFKNLPLKMTEKVFVIYLYYVFKSSFIDLGYIDIQSFKKVST